MAITTSFKSVMTKTRTDQGKVVAEDDAGAYLEQIRECGMVAEFEASFYVTWREDYYYRCYYADSWNSETRRKRGKRTMMSAYARLLGDENDDGSCCYCFRLVYVRGRLAKRKPAKTATNDDCWKRRKTKTLMRNCGN